MYLGSTSPFSISKSCNLPHILVNTAFCVQYTAPPPLPLLPLPHLPPLTNYA